MVKIYLIRHVKAEGNVKGFIQGRVDTQVMGEGLLQLDALAERFRSIPIEAVYTSPLKRAVSTAEAVNRYHSLPIIRDEGIIEIDFGKMEGCSKDELYTRFPVESEIWDNCINKFAAPDGESSGQVYDRMSAAMNRIAGENIGKTIAVVSHGMAIKAYLNFAAGIKWENYEDPGWSDNSAVSLIEYDDELRPHIIFKNDSSHLQKQEAVL